MQRNAHMSSWLGRTDIEEGPLGRRWNELVQPLKAQTEGVALVGFVSDAGVARNHGRVGAKDSPAALRVAIANLPARGCDQIVDAGDVVCVDDDLEAAQAELSQALAALLARGLLPITLGGGHEVAFGSFGGLAQHLAASASPPFTSSEAARGMGIVNLDAHLDLRLADRASSGTPFQQIAEDCTRRGWPFRYCCLRVSEFANTMALFKRANTLGATWLCDEEMDPARLDDTLAVVDHFLRGVDHVYLTICLDVLPAAVAPGVSAPAARGVGLQVIEAIVDRVAESGKVRLADVAELNPRFDIDSHTASVAARLVGRLVEAVWARRVRQ